jgi:NADH-quinone oxidoreductase subunit J
MGPFLFWAFASVAVVSALLCITRRSPVASALWLVLTMCALSALFLLLDAQFLAIIQVLVYAGAIMVLFLFVIMLLNLGRGGPSDLRGWFGRAVAFLFAAGIVVQLLVLFRAVRGPGGFAAETAAYPLPAGELARLQAARGALGMVADPLLRQYLVPFEITSVLLLAAIVGAVVLAKRKI